MKTYLKNLLCMLMIISVVFTLFIPAFASYDTATEIVMDQAYSDSISSDDADDYFKFTTEKYGRVRLYITTSMRPITVTIYDAEKKEVKSWNTTRSTEGTIVHNEALDAGTYYLRVSGRGTGLLENVVLATGGYSFRMTFTAETKPQQQPQQTQPAEKEETDADTNNSAADAKTVLFKTTNTGKILKDCEEDYYVFEVPSSGSVNLKITSKMQYYCAYLLDANSNKLWSSENNQYDAAKKQRTDSYDFELSAGTYYLKINGLKASNFPYYLTRSKGNYSFALTFATAGQTSVEPNDSLVNPNKISLGNKVVGHLSLTDKADYYEVTVAAGGAMIAFNSYLNSYNIRVLDADNKEVWSSRDNALAEKATSRKDLHELNLSAGTYFVVVDGGMGKYNFVFSKKVSVGKVKKVSYDRSTTAITLEWSKVSGAAGYEIFRYDEKKKDYVKIGSTTTKRYLTLKNLKSGTTYKFKVRAYKKLNDSVIYGAFSSEKATTTVPAKTTIKSAKAIGKNKATVTWSAVNGATGYVVYYTTDKDFDYVDSTRVKDGKATSKTLKKLKKGKKYYFKVKAYKSFNGKRVYGAISKTKSAKIK